MEHSTEIKQISAALAKSQAEFPNFEKGKTVTVVTKTGGRYSYSYTDLGSLIEKTKKILAANGIAVTQGLDQAPGTGAVITTMLIHTSGEWFRYVLTLPIVDEFKNSIQAAGSAFTYGRRYALAAALCIASDADDDATGAGDGGTKKSASQPAAGPTAAGQPAPDSKGPVISDAQRKRMYAIAKGQKWTDEECKKFLVSKGFKSSSDVTKAAYEAVCEVFGKPYPKEELKPEPAKMASEYLNLVAKINQVKTMVDAEQASAGIAFAFDDGKITKEELDKANSILAKVIEAKKIKA